MSENRSETRPEQKRAAYPAGSGATISASEFKAKCLKVMDEVHETHREIVITKYGKPVAKLVPADDEIPDSFGCLRGTVSYHGDIVAPDQEEWDETDP